MRGLFGLVSCLSVGKIPEAIVLLFFSSPYDWYFEAPSLLCMVLHLPFLLLVLLPGCEEGARCSASVLRPRGVRDA